MGLFRSLTGLIRVKYTSADIGLVLREFERNQINMFDVNASDELTINFTVAKQHLEILKSIAERRGEKIEICGRLGLFWTLRAVLRRQILIWGISVLVMLNLYLPCRIMFVQVDGNTKIPDSRILEAAAEAGLGFWADRRSIRSEQVKNRLMDEIPELGWVGVNTYGSRAVITVRERDDDHEKEEPLTVRHIVASRDGIVAFVTITDGCGVCTVGQAVKKGDTLISGYTNCGITIRAEAAAGQIMAMTQRNLTVLTPSEYAARDQMKESVVRYSMILGKKRINFYKGSGISGAGCVKMYLDYVLRLPGGFALPVSLRKEYVSEYSFVLSDTADPAAMLESFAANYLSGQMVSGTVNKKAETLTQTESFWLLEGEYACTEDIGAVQDGKIGDFHGKADGTDRERGSGG